MVGVMRLSASVCLSLYAKHPTHDITKKYPKRETAFHHKTNRLRKACPEASVRVFDEAN